MNFLLETAIWKYKFWKILDFLFKSKYKDEYSVFKLARVVQSSDPEISTDEYDKKIQKIHVLIRVDLVKRSWMIARTRMQVVQIEWTLNDGSMPANTIWTNPPKAHKLLRQIYIFYIWIKTSWNLKIENWKDSEWWFCASQHNLHQPLKCPIDKYGLQFNKSTLWFGQI